MDKRDWNMWFESVLMDKETQAIEPDTVMGMWFGAQHLVVVDHMQLCLVVQSISCNKTGFDKSLFQRLMELSVHPVHLKLQYHIHPALSALPINSIPPGNTPE